MMRIQVYVTHGGAGTGATDRLSLAADHNLEAHALGGDIRVPSARFTTDTVSNSSMKKIDTHRLT
jgi:hypothetical protein